jgi:hypothetical protein
VRAALYASKRPGNATQSEESTKNGDIQGGRENEGGGGSLSLVTVPPFFISL